LVFKVDLDCEQQVASLEKVLVVVGRRLFRIRGFIIGSLVLINAVDLNRLLVV
jgi:acetolactate synthase regulatory subunit